VGPNALHDGISTSHKGRGTANFKLNGGGAVVECVSAQPQGLNLADVAAEDISGQSSAIYQTSPKQIQAAQSEPSIQAGLTPADQPFVNSPAPPLSPVVTGTVGKSDGVPRLDSKANCHMAETLGVAQNADTCLFAGEQRAASASQQMGRVSER
jgi:hypothetical protein